MNEEQKMVSEFHKKFGSKYLDKPKPKIPDTKILLLRTRLLIEEVSEFTAAASVNDIVGMADALADILYVTYGAAIELGIDIEPIFEEVHKSNMSKTGTRDGSGKIQKGESFFRPNLLPILLSQGLENANINI